MKVIEVGCELVKVMCGDYYELSELRFQVENWLLEDQFDFGGGEVVIFFFVLGIEDLFFVFFVIREGLRLFMRWYSIIVFFQKSFVWDID